jgi:zinc protease
MEKLSCEEAMKFYHKYYHPANMILIVSGDIEKEKLKALAEKYYGNIKPKEKYIRNWQSEPPQRAQRRVNMAHNNVKQPTFMRYYAVPSLVVGDKEKALPLMIFADILGGGDTSILYKELVEGKEIALSVSASYSPFAIGESVFSIGAVPAEGVDLEDLEEAINKIIARTLSEPIDISAVERSKSLVRADMIYSRDGLQEIAQYIGYFRMLGLSVDDFKSWTQKISDIKSETIFPAAKALLNNNASVTGYLLPEKEKNLE